MIVTFIGHRSLYGENNLSEKVKKVILENIPADDTVLFYCGEYGTFDRLCANVCRSLKEQFPNCKVVFITPYITESQQKKMQYLLDHHLYDFTLYPSLENVPFRYAIIRRNEWMVNEADLIIAYVENTFGGAYKTLSYAHSKKKRIINLAEY